MGVFLNKFRALCLICGFLMHVLCASVAIGSTHKILDSQYEFSRVVDGDTILLFTDVNSSNGFLRSIKRILHIKRPHITVRILGINSPESVDPRRPPECGGKEASFELASILRSTDQYDIRLVSDSTQPYKDVFGRTLAYVELWKGDQGIDVGAEMLARGYAREFTYDKEYDRRQEYVETERLAQKSRLGIWSEKLCPVLGAPGLGH